MAADVASSIPGITADCRARTFVLGLRDGQIILTSGYGPGLNTGAVAHEAITGGTGAYQNARGQGDDREVGNTGLKLHLLLLP